jgi:hypothetical protein
MTPLPRPPPSSHCAISPASVTRNSEVCTSTIQITASDRSNSRHVARPYAIEPSGPPRAGITKTIKAGETHTPNTPITKIWVTGEQRKHGVYVRRKQGGGKYIKKKEEEKKSIKYRVSGHGGIGRGKKKKIIIIIKKRKRGGGFAEKKKKKKKKKPKMRRTQVKKKLAARIDQQKTTPHSETNSNNNTISIHTNKEKEMPTK